jgi:hypothetical protein
MKSGTLSHCGGSRFSNRYNRPMRFRALVILVFTVVSLAQTSSLPKPESKSTTVSITLDHNRIIINVGIPLPDGTTQRVRAWVDNGDPDLVLSHRVAKMMGLTLLCAGQVCSTPTRLPEIRIGDVNVPLSNIGQKIREEPENAMSVAFPGMSAEINIPSTVLRNYDVLINYPGHELTIAQPGTLKFKGVSARVIVNAENGLVQVPSQIENKKHNLALDLGSSISFLAGELFDKLSAAHPDWPHMTGAIGPANLWGLDDEPKWKVMRVDRLQYGPLFFTNVAMVDFPEDRLAYFEKRAGIATAGLLGASALQNYRIGLDYAHSAVYFDVGRLFNFPEFDVIGLILRPEDDGRFTILSIADLDGKPSVAGRPDGVQPGDHLVAVDDIPVAGSTMGQVWSMLGGELGKERKLTVDRSGKQFTVVAKVQHFLGEVAEDDKSKGNPRKK